MTQRQDEIDTEALDWVVRVGDPAFGDWAAFQDWLERDPSHAGAYHALLADTEDAVAALKAPPVVVARVSAVADRRGRRLPRAWAGGAIAASLAVVAGFAAFERRPQPYAIETIAGDIRDVALADGSRVVLGGGTRVMLDKRNARIASLEQGEAMFFVKHDDADPFTVRVDDARLVDVGTAFDVKRSDAGTRVAVSDGAVDVTIGARAVRLVAGQDVLLSDSREPQVGIVDAADVGAWRSGRLVFDGTSMRQVAADLSRSLGIDIRADPAIAGRSVRATIATAGLARDPRGIGPLLGVSVRRSGDGWAMSAR